MTHSPRVSVVVPTYREAENLPVLLARIFAATDGAGLSCEVVVVDDDSRDGTDEACATDPRAEHVRLVVRRGERGLATAVVRGLQEARGEVLLVMDADLSHPPEKIPELVAALDDPGTDFVIGSRYVDGGSLDETWGFFRRANSKVATWLAAGLVRARDPMAGFFALRRGTFEQAPELHPFGYKIALEILVRCGCRNVAEVPIDFRDRTRGESKLDLRQQWLYLKHLGLLYTVKYPGLFRFAKFGAVGASGAVVDLGTLVALGTLLSFGPARSLAIWAAMTWNFVWNRQVTFSDRNEGSLLGQYLGFCAASLTGAVLNWTTSVALWRWAGFAQLASSIMGIGLAAVVNYVLCSVFVFGKKPSTQTAPLATAEFAGDGAATDEPATIPLPARPATAAAAQSGEQRRRAA